MVRARFCVGLHERMYVCSFLQPSITSPILRPNTLLGTLFSNTHKLCFSFTMTDQFHIDTKQRVQLQMCKL
jgi:hypothetical protein